MAEKRFYTVQEFHDELGGIITRAQIYTMIKEGEIPVRRIGRKIVMPASWVEEYVNRPCEYVKQDVIDKLF
jgi:excisionase family DNA binding protein